MKDLIKQEQTNKHEEIQMKEKKQIAIANDENRIKQRGHSQPPLGKPFKRRINLIKKINDMQLQLMATAYKRSDNAHSQKKKINEISSSLSSGDSKKMFAISEDKQKQNQNQILIENSNRNSSSHTQVPQNIAKDAISFKQQQSSLIHKTNEGRCKNKEVKVEDKYIKNKCIKQNRVKEQCQNGREQPLEQRDTSSSNSLDNDSQLRQKDDTIVDKINQAQTLNQDTIIIRTTTEQYDVDITNPNQEDKNELTHCKESLCTSLDNSNSNLSLYSQIQQQQLEGDQKEGEQIEEGDQIRYLNNSNKNNSISKVDTNKLTNKQKISPQIIHKSLSFEILEEKKPSPLKELEVKQYNLSECNNYIRIAEISSLHLSTGVEEDQTQTYNHKFTPRLDNNFQTNVISKLPLQNIINKHHNVTNRRDQFFNKQNNDDNYEQSPRILYQFQEIDQKLIPSSNILAISEPHKQKYLNEQIKKTPQLQDSSQFKRVNKSSLNQYVKGLKHKKIDCNQTLNPSTCLEKQELLNQQNECNTLPLCSTVGRRRVLSQQSTTTAHQNQHYNNNTDHTREKYNLILNQSLNMQDQQVRQHNKCVTPSEKGMNERRHEEKRRQLNKLDGIKMDTILEKYTYHHLISLTAESANRKGNQSISDINHFKQTISPRRNYNFNRKNSNNDGRSIENRTTKNEEQDQQMNKKRIALDEQKQQYLNRQQEFLEQIDNSQITPSFVKDIIYNISQRSKVILNNISLNGKKNFKIQSNLNKINALPSPQTSTKSKRDEGKESREQLCSRQFLSNKPEKKHRCKTTLQTNSSMPPSSINFIDTNQKCIQSGKQSDIEIVKKKYPQAIRSNCTTPKVGSKNDANLNERYSKLILQLNLDTKIQDIKQMIETSCRPNRRNSFLKPQQKKQKQVRFKEDHDDDDDDNDQLLLHNPEYFLPKQY